MQHSVLFAVIGSFIVSAGSAAQARPVRAGQECRPAVANEALYANCRLAVVGADVRCRCAVLSGAVLGASPEPSAKPAKWSAYLRGDTDRGGRDGSSNEALGAAAGNAGGLSGNNTSGGARGAGAGTSTATSSDSGPRHSDPIPGPAN